MHGLGSLPTERPSKIIMLGDSSVGKTSIVLQFYKSEFETASEPTIGAAYVTKDMQTKNGRVSMHIWDTAGQERFKSVIPMYTRGCSAAILVCTTDSIESVTALDGWLKIIQETVSSLQNIYVALNKIDLDPVYDLSIAEGWARKHGFRYYRTSAKDKSTIDPLFQDIAESLVARGMTPDIQALPANADKSKGCCG
jgi:small GTP-binding protein